MFFSGAMDIGHGNDNMLAQIASGELEIRPEVVQLVTADTEVTPSTPGACSQVSPPSSEATRPNVAAGNLKIKVFETASDVLGGHEEGVAPRNRTILDATSFKQSNLLYFYLDISKLFM